MNYIRAYLNQNLGDDMFVDLLLKLFSNESFYICCEKKNAKGFLNNNNVAVTNPIAFKILKLMNRLGIINLYDGNPFAIRCCKAIVRIGGSVFIEPKNWETNPYKSKVNKRTFFIGSNFGPYKNESFFNEVYRRIEQSRDICFRDTYSYSLFSNLSNVRYAPDCLFAYPVPKEKKFDNLIGISVISMAKRSNFSVPAEDYYSGISNFINLAINKGYQIRLFSFCKEEGDMNAIEDIVNRVEVNKKVDVVSYEGDIDNTLRSLSECSVMLATRFHAMILGWVFEQKVIPIVYSNKQTNVMNDVNFDGYSVNLLDGVFPQADELLEQIKNAKIINVDKHKDESIMQFKVFEEYLNCK